MNVIRAIVGKLGSLYIKLEKSQRKWIFTGPGPPFKLSGGADVQNSPGGVSISNAAESTVATRVAMCPRMQASNVQFISHICCLCLIWEPGLERDIDWHRLPNSICSTLQYCPWYQNVSVWLKARIRTAHNNTGQSPAFIYCIQDVVLSLFRD